MSKNVWQAVLRALGLGVALAGLLAGSAQAQNKVFKMGAMAWEDLQAISLVTKKQLEAHGYQVEYRTFSEWGIAYAALQKGDINLFVTFTEYVAADYWDRYKERLEKISNVSHGLYQALAVPSYMPINSMLELNSVADQVKGRIIGVEPGSGLMREAAEAIKAYGLNYQLIDGSTPAMGAQLKSALERKEPIVTMLWTTSWMMHAFDVKFLDDPKGIFAPQQAYSLITRRGFLDDDWRARQLMANVFVPMKDVVQMMAQINEGQTVQQAVDGWWAAHPGLVARWASVASK